MIATSARRDRLDTQIAEMATNSEFTPITRRLGCLRGISTLTGFALAVEIGDWTRFSGASIGAFVGLTPSEHSSGSTRSLGSITKTGNGHARRLLVEAAWHHRPAYRLGKTMHDRWALASITRAGPRGCGEPAAASTVAAVHRPQEARYHRCGRDRPRAGRLVLVLGHPRPRRHHDRVAESPRSSLSITGLAEPRQEQPAIKL